MIINIILKCFNETQRLQFHKVADNSKHFGNIQLKGTLWKCSTKLRGTKTSHITHKIYKCVLLIMFFYDHFVGLIYSYIYLSQFCLLKVLFFAKFWHKAPQYRNNLCEYKSNVSVGFWWHFVLGFILGSNI